MKLAESEMKELERKLPDFTRASLERVLSAVPETNNKLTDKEWAELVHGSPYFAPYNSMRDAINTVLSRRPSQPAPEPSSISGTIAAFVVIVAVGWAGVMAWQAWRILWR